MTRVAIFVDTQNVYYTVREAYGKHFDYRQFPYQHREPVHTDRGRSAARLMR